ncbi:MAG: hypothetical protein WA002_17940 [Candidatus Acidiferrales bacterium]
MSSHWSQARRLLTAALMIGAAFLIGRAHHTGAADSGYKVHVVQDSAPQELTAAVRETMAPDALRISGPDGHFGTLWLRQNIPPASSTNRAPGVAFGQLSEGSLIGAVRIAGTAADYRNQAIRPGVYTLRYDIQPIDANHAGVSPYRDFLLLVPASLDLTPAPILGKDLLDDSRKASGTTHPLVLSLLPPDAAPVTIPVVTHVADGDLWVLYFRAAVPAAATNPGPAVLGLIIVGHVLDAS